MIDIWCDFLAKGFLQNEFKDLIDKKIINGATSNPSIFENALKNDEYKSDIQNLKSQKLRAKEIYEKLVLQDIYNASKILYPVFKKDGNNGFVSIEIDPNLCDDANESIKEGMNIFEELDCPNVMIKVPATNDGYVVMKELFAKNINVNATLVFSSAQMQECLKAFSECGSDAKAVISIFVSRYDRFLDERLENKGQYAIFNAINIYNDFLKYNKNPNVRLLFASTGVKNINEIYTNEGYYVYPLAFDNCINTMPLNTLNNIDLNKIKTPSAIDLEPIKSEVKEKISKNMLDIESVNEKLLSDGLKLFKNSFNSMLSLLQ